MKNRQPSSPQVRVRVAVYGAVQGVGFRPFIHHLAMELELAGWVNNSPQGVYIEVEGPRPVLEQFISRLSAERPAPSFIQGIETSWLDAAGYNSFEIRASQVNGEKTTLVLPDIATCPDCLREILDPTNRRFRYPFTNCTHCGPRFSIIQSLPYDRANTTMREFKMCSACQKEYDNSQDRRFHAQPNACPACGPQLEFWQPDGTKIFGGHMALLAAAQAIRRGKVVAAKGIGGYHLLVDARNAKAVARLRERKHREEKPLALLFPSVASARRVCSISAKEEGLLLSPAAPIVLVAKLPQVKSAVARGVAPGNPNLGIMLPSNPLHHLLMAELGFPVVATSGNLSDEPLCTDEREALQRLRGIADCFLVHDRPIVRHVDDSIVRVILDRELVLRRARGYAPLPVTISANGPQEPHKPILAVGAHLKNSVALAVGQNVFISQHIGDLETEAANTAFRRVTMDLQQLFGARAGTIAADLHPDYLSTQFAHDSGIACLEVQHHVAHVLSCIAENDVQLPALGVAWDGTGYGTDGTIWGGEFFEVTHDSVERVASLRPFRLPGSNAAAREPRRAALGMLHEMYGESVFDRQELPPVAAFTAAELHLLQTMLNRGLNSPKTSSMGRCFDAVAALLNVRQQMHFEGQAAMELEFALQGIFSESRYELPLITRHALCLLDWAPMIVGVMNDSQRGVPVGEISAGFHNTLAQAVAEVAQRFGHKRVVLSGGCFQNGYLLERTVGALEAAQFKPYWHQRVPPNDGGIALGQVLAVIRAQTKNKPKLKI